MNTQDEQELEFHRRKVKGDKFQEHVKSILMVKGYYVSYYLSGESQRRLGENNLGIEVKLDSRCTERKKKNENWLRVVISKKDRIDLQFKSRGGSFGLNIRHFLVGNYEEFWMLPISPLNTLIATSDPSCIEMAGTRDYIEFALPMNIADRMCTEKYGINAESKNLHESPSLHKPRLVLDEDAAKIYDGGCPAREWKEMNNQCLLDNGMRKFIVD